MPIAGIVTLIGVALTVAALALYLISVALMLRHVSFTLGTVIAGVWSIAHQTEPLRGVMDQIINDVSQARTTLDRLLESKGVKGVRSSSLRGGRPGQ